jgi:hypothetical protein
MGRAPTIIVGGTREIDLMVNAVGAVAHDAWRAPRLDAASGLYEPRVKVTTYQRCITAHKATEVDIANTPYGQLPGDWQLENKLSAEFAVTAVLDGASRGYALDSAFVEETAAALHAWWLERNREYATDEQLLPYLQLSETEKSKDRLFVEAARAAYLASGPQSSAAYTRINE